MHIAFDISQTGRGKAGCGYFAHALMQRMPALAPRHAFHALPSFGDFFFDPAMPVRNPYRDANVRYGPRHWTRAAAASFWNAPDLEDRLGQPEVLHANNFWAPVRLARTRLVYTAYDLGFLHDPSWTTEANRVGCFDGLFRAAQAADWVVAISQCTARDFLHHFPHVPADRVRVIAPSSRFEASLEGRAPAHPLQPGRFWLSVGTIEPRKNQRFLAQAYAGSLAQGGEPMPLVLAGGAGWLMESFDAELRALGVQDRVVRLGYVSDAELAWLYRNCRANLYPSRFEGFGLPVLEAMQFGAACVVSNAGSLPEVAGDAAILLAPDDLAGWTDAMLRLAKDDAERSRLSAAGRERATQFDPRRSAEAVLALYEEAAATPKRALPVAEAA